MNGMTLWAEIRAAISDTRQGCDPATSIKLNGTDIRALIALEYPHGPPEHKPWVRQLFREKLPDDLQLLNLPLQVEDGTGQVTYRSGRHRQVGQP